MRFSGYYFHRSTNILGELQILLGAVDMKIVFPLFSRLTGKKILFHCIHVRNISPPGLDLFWRTGKILGRSQYSKRVI